MTRFYGKRRGEVVDASDPLGLGRVRAKVPDVYGDEPSPWALLSMPVGITTDRIVQLNAGDLVWVEFESGDADWPICSGRIPTARSVTSAIEDGHLALHGEDSGPQTATISPTGCYEWFRTVDAADFPQLVELHGGKPRDHILDVLKRAWTGSKSGDILQVLSKSDIKVKFVAFGGPLAIRPGFTAAYGNLLPTGVGNPILSIRSTTRVACSSISWSASGPAHMAHLTPLVPRCASSGVRR